MTTYAEAQAEAKRNPPSTADGVVIVARMRIRTPADCAGQVLEVAHSMDEIGPGCYEPWHLVRLDTGCVTAYPSDLLWARSVLPVTRA